MSKKNDLQTIYECWQEDVQLNRTKSDASVLISPHLVSARTVKQGGIVEMGVAPEIITEMVTDPNKRIFVLLVIDRQRFTEIQNS